MTALYFWVAAALLTLGWRDDFRAALTLKTPGVTIRARRGYVASPLPPPKAIRR